MPQTTGGSSTKGIKKKPTKPAPARGRYEAQAVAKTKGTSLPTSQVNPKPGPAAKSKAISIDKPKSTTAKKNFQTDLKESRTIKQRKTNADQFGFTTPSIRKRRTGGAGGVATGGGGGTVGGGGRTGGGGGGKTIGGLPESKLGGNFRDRDLVGSENIITDYDGQEFSGGGNVTDSSTGGGGSGSGLFGRESVSRVGDTEGKSIEEVIYGVRKRSKKIARAKGE